MDSIGLCLWWGSLQVVDLNGAGDGDRTRDVPLGKMTEDRTSSVMAFPEAYRSHCVAPVSLIGARMESQRNHD